VAKERGTYHLRGQVSGSTGVGTVGLDDLRDLPAVLRVWSPDPREPTLAGVLGLSKAATWAGVHAGQLPARRVGHRWLVPTPALLRWLGAEVDTGNGHGQMAGADGERAAPLVGRGAAHAPAGE
jgi:hypothetical protein